MERLGIYIIYFFIIGMAVLERARTKGETGNIWQLLCRNAIISIVAFVSFFLLGYDLMNQFPANWQPFLLFNSFINHSQNDSLTADFDGVWLACVKAVAATVLVATGIWELRLKKWSKRFLLLVFCLLIYPLFGKSFENQIFLGLKTLSEDGTILHPGIYDHAKVLLVWALPSAFILGCRLMMPANVLPIERRHHLKGVKILPGIKHRFLLSRGIGFIMVFLILNTPSLVNLFPNKEFQGKTLWIISKTLMLLPASFVILFSNILFFGLFGRNNIERTSHAPPLLAIMAVLISSQACNQYDLKETLIVGATITFTALLFLRLVPLNARIWDPACSIATFLFGSAAGILAASFTGAADFPMQARGIVACVFFGLLCGCTVTLALRAIGALQLNQTNVVPNKRTEDLDPADNTIELKEKP